MMKVHVNRNWSLGGMNPDGSGLRRRVTAAQWALFAAGMVLLVPLVALVLAALLVGIVVFVLMATVMRIIAAAGSVLPGGGRRDDLSDVDDQGRVNVRVIRGRDEGM